MADQVGYKVRLLSKLRTFTPAYTHTDSVYIHYIGRLEGVHTDTHRHTHKIHLYRHRPTYVRIHTHTHKQTNIHVHDTAYTYKLYLCTYVPVSGFSTSS